HRLGLLHHAHEELRLDVHAHAVAGDHGLAVYARYRDAHHVQVDRRDLVHDRQHQRAAVDDHLLAAEAGPDERDFAGRAVIEPVEQVHHHRDDHDGDDKPQDD